MRSRTVIALACLLVSCIQRPSVLVAGASASAVTLVLESDVAVLLDSESQVVAHYTIEPNGSAQFSLHLQEASEAAQVLAFRPVGDKQYECGGCDQVALPERWSVLR